MAATDVTCLVGAITRHISRCVLWDLYGGDSWRALGWGMTRRRSLRGRIVELSIWTKMKLVRAHLICNGNPIIL